MVTFGMAITIPEHEMYLCRELMRYAWIAAGLTNDLFSWQKEYDASRRSGRTDVVNAILVLMGEHSITVEEAELLCRRKIKEYVAKYIKVVENTSKRLDLSLDLRKYVEAMQYSLSGNVVWSLLCPRYHAEANYNELQLSLMKHGVGKRSLDPNAGLENSLFPSLINAAEFSNGVKTVNDVNGVTGIHGVESVDGDHASSPHGTTNGVIKKGKVHVDETNGVRIVKPRLNTHNENADYLKPSRALPDLGDKVSAFLTSTVSEPVPLTRLCTIR